MELNFERTERTFSAAEVDEFFGVPEMMQRDWRRREKKGDFAKEGFTSFFRPAHKGKRFEFTLDEACALALAKIQIDAGKSVPSALWVGKMCTNSAVLCIELAQQSVELQGIDATVDERRDLIWGLNDLTPGDDYTRFLFFPTRDDLFRPLLPDVSSEPGATAYHFHSLSAMEEQVRPDWVHGQIFSLEAFAFSLAAKMRGTPLITYRLIEAEQ